MGQSGVASVAPAAMMFANMAHIERISDETRHISDEA